MIDIVIGCVSGYDFSVISPWISSLKKTGSKAKQVLIVLEASEILVSQLVKEGVTVVNKDVYGKTGNSAYNNVDRFFNIVEYLKEFVDEDIRYVIATDVRDVIFQRDPIEWLENNLGDYEIVASGEGFLYENEPWSRRNLTDNFGEEVFEKVRKNEIFCAGVIAGKREAITRLFSDIWLDCAGKPQHSQNGGGPDQSAYNIQLDKYDNRVLKVSNNSDWACQVGTTIPAIKAESGDIGLAYKQSTFKGLFLDEVKKANPHIETPRIENHKLINSANQVYYIVHQYDRVPDWREDLLEIDVQTTLYINTDNYNKSNRIDNNFH